MTVVTQNKIDILTGMIAPFGMSSVPTGWLACDGSAVSRTTYADLFTAIGTTWGAGDGSSTFALPDLEGAFLRGTGSNNTHNMADGNDYAGPSVGQFESDQNQSHQHTGGQRGPGGGSAVGLYKSIGDDGTWSTTSQGGDEARPFNAGVKYCIKY